MACHKRIGVLLVNLGTPRSPAPKAVFHYLNEFLTDGRVIDLPWLSRQLLVRLLIVPRRFRASAKLYSNIWTTEGSPLFLHSQAAKHSLQALLGKRYVVSLGMRYQRPSIKEALKELEAAHVSKLIVLPLFPQYASATTGSVHQKVMEDLSHWQVIPETHFINSYPLQTEMLEAFYERGKACQPENFDHFVFSFHGLPDKHLRKASSTCLSSTDCCKEASSGCYKAQCFSTALGIAQKFAWEPHLYSVCFQSRLGKEPWTRPYTDETLIKLAKEGKKKVLVFAPSFTCDCLETLDEIGREYAHQFQCEGGQTLQLVPSLNDHPLWIEGMRSLITRFEAHG